MTARGSRSQKGRLSHSSSSRSWIDPPSDFDPHSLCQDSIS